MSLVVKMVAAMAWVFLARSFVVSWFQGKINEKGVIARNTPFLTGENIVTFLEIVVFILI